MVKDKTGGDRQSRLRLARSKWLKEHGYNSVEGLLGALMRGEVVLQVVSVPTPRAADALPCGHNQGIEFGESSWSCVVCGHPVRR